MDKLQNLHVCLRLAAATAHRLLAEPCLDDSEFIECCESLLRVLQDYVDTESATDVDPLSWLPLRAGGFDNE